MLLTGLFPLCGVYAQQKDAGLWASVTLEKKLRPTLTWSLSDEFRLNENISELGTHFTETGLDLKILRGLSAGVYYRFMQKRRLDDSYSKRHRYFFEMDYKRSFNKLSLTLRERVQDQYADMFSSQDGKVGEWTCRTKLTARYKLPGKFQVFGFTEAYYSMNDPEGNEFTDIRFAAGMQYTLHKIHSFEAFYLVNKELNKKNPLTEYIIGLGYGFSL